MKLNISLTRIQLSHLIAVMGRTSGGNKLETEIMEACKQSMAKHNEKVRAAENFLAMVRDTEEEQTG